MAKLFDEQSLENRLIAVEIQGAISAIEGKVSTPRSRSAAALASRSAETAAAIRLLLHNEFQFIDDASSLLRVLIEHVIDAAFIAASTEEIAAKYIAFGDVEACRMDEYARSDFPEFRSPSAPEEYRKAKDEAIVQFPGIYKNLSWHSNLYLRAKEADISYGDRCFSYLYTMYRPLSTYVHGNSLSTAKRVHQEDTHVGLGRRYADGENADVMYGTNCALLALGLVLDTHFHQSQNVHTWHRWIGALQKVDAISQVDEL